ncbi:NADH-quinone oxidoreductase subunit J family protein [Siphonobacter curvatus]|uniref:NADH-quinone oxidoreductase subunit J n=1 Tax=Siphonobacter curvatus TaxID=2094562 RepID=A0A2S7ILL9_9BACT|nr:NADH-quinone oxidoreductase subunit J [Siphonobacter curvatus]PQA58546.1 NADH-quinone oxidoreductase subunit J [Siphonobacter curvatus]
MSADKIWYLLTALTIIFALAVILVRNPMYSVLCLVLTFLCLSCHYILLNAQFLAVVNLIVYAGAIMVLFLFVVMFLNLREYREETKSNLQKVAAFVVGIAILGAIVMAVRRLQYPMPSPEQFNVRTGYVEVLGETLFMDYLLPFELVTILFFVAMVGAVMLGKREKGERHF